MTLNVIYTNMKKKQSKAVSIHDLAIALCERRNVWFHCHTIRLVKVVGNGNPCELCDMDCLCDMEMVDLCGECQTILRKPCLLKLVTQRI